MNKLRLNIDGRMKTDEPFVIQISSKPQTFNSNFCASYARQDEKVQVWCIHGEFSFTLSKKDSIEDDICIVFPETQQLIRQYRAHSNSNTLLITEQCDQTCLMCSQPPKNKFYDDYDLYIQVMKLTPVKSVIGISGGEPLLEKNKLFLFIDKILAIRPDLQFHILTNAQHFGMEDLSFIKNTKNNIVWCIPLYSSNPTLHDDIVCKVGAYKQLLKSLNILFVAGSIVELRTVLIKQNQWELPKLADFIGKHLSLILNWSIMQLENEGYAKMNWQSLFVDTSIDFSYVDQAITIANNYNIITKLYNFPLCTIPIQYSNLSCQSISDWKRIYLEDCRLCHERKNCGGFFKSYPRNSGYQSIGIL